LVCGGYLKQWSRQVATNESVKSKAPQSGKETKVDMQMKLSSATEADLENLNDSSSPLFKMKKVQ
jgi:hypothetical protein